MSIYDMALMRFAAASVALFFALQIADRWTGTAWERGMEHGKKLAELDRQTKELQGKPQAD